MYILCDLEVYIMKALRPLFQTMEELRLKQRNKKEVRIGRRILLEWASEGN